MQQDGGGSIFDVKDIDPEGKKFDRGKQQYGKIVDQILSRPRPSLMAIN